MLGLREVIPPFIDADKVAAPFSYSTCFLSPFGWNCQPQRKEQSLNMYSGPPKILSGCLRKEPSCYFVTSWLLFYLCWECQRDIHSSVMVSPFLIQLLSCSLFKITPTHRVLRDACLSTLIMGKTRQLGGFCRQENHASTPDQESTVLLCLSVVSADSHNSLPNVHVNKFLSSWVGLEEHMELCNFNYSLNELHENCVGEKRSQMTLATLYSAQATSSQAATFQTIGLVLYYWSKKNVQLINIFHPWLFPCLPPSLLVPVSYHRSYPQGKPKPQSSSLCLSPPFFVCADSCIYLLYPVSVFCMGEGEMNVSIPLPVSEGKADMVPIGKVRGKIFGGKC